jgi:aldehyde:ferredoxin oxidoreductase
VGAVVEKQEFERMKDEYYELRGWDVATGRQTKKKLEEMGLDDIVEGLDHWKVGAGSG